MKTIGMIGGTTWLSTIDYYRIINENINLKLGGNNSAKILLYSLNFEEFKPPVTLDEFNPFINYLTTIAQNLEKAGAECLVICANTPHMVADQVQMNIKIPLINIAEETGKVVKLRGIKTVGLLGTKFTMEMSFYKDKLMEHGIQTLIPDLKDRAFIHESIYKELAKGIFSIETKTRYTDIIQQLINDGAEGIILGCTEIPLLIKQENSIVPVFDTTLIHATAAVNYALKQ